MTQPTFPDLNRMLQQSVGQKMMRFSINSDFVQGLVRITKAHLISLRDAGELSAIPMRDPERSIVAEDWNDMVAGKDVSSLLDRTLAFTITRYLQLLAADIARSGDAPLDPHNLVMTGEMVTPLESVLAEEITNGFPSIEHYKDHLWGQHPPAWDKRLDEECLVTFTNWQPKFWKQEGDDYTFVPVDLNADEPDLVHFTIPAGEPVWLVSSMSGPKIITDALYAAHVEKMDLPNRFNGDVGKLEHSRNTQEKTGVMSVYLGDHFPKIVREIETGRAYLVAFGQTNAPEEAEKIKEECPEDWASGYFLIEDPRFDMTSETTVERFSIATQTDLLNLVAAESGESPEAILTMMEKDLASAYPDLVRLDAFPEEAHVYIPYGGAVHMSHKAFTDAGHYPFTGGHDCALIISPTPLDFPVGVVEELGVESPRQRADVTGLIT